MEHYICRTITELPGYIQAQFRVPENTEIVAGEVFNAEELYNNTYGNYTVYLPTLMEDVNDEPAIIINNSFETLNDGRRPDGQPDYTQYTFGEGEVVTALRLNVPNPKFELSVDACDDTVSAALAAGTLVAGDNLIPKAAQYELTYSKKGTAVTAKNYLTVEALKFFRLGGKSGGEMANTLVVRTKVN